MKLKCLLAAAMLFGATSATFAQSEDSEGKNYVAVPHYSSDEKYGFGGMKNDIKIDFNCGWFVSEVVDRDGDSNRGMFGCGFSLMYEHVFKNGCGFGINGIFEQGEGSDITTGVIAPSFVYYVSKNTWTYGCSIGIGYGRFNLDSYRYGYEDANGLGTFVQGNIEKRITKNFGIGAGIRLVNITASKPDNNSYYDSHSYGTSSLRFTIGPRFYF